MCAHDDGWEILLVLDTHTGPAFVNPVLKTPIKMLYAHFTDGV